MLRLQIRFLRQKKRAERSIRNSLKDMRTKMRKIPSMLLSVRKQEHSVSTGSMKVVQG